MPELPEVETTVRALKERILGKKIQEVYCGDKPMRYPMDPSLPGLLEGRVIEQVVRRAKYFYWQLNQGYLLFHLGMSGSIHFSPVSKKHDHFSCTLNDRSYVTLNDPRRFGFVLYMDTLDFKPLLRLGVEPLSDDFSWAYLQSKSNRMNRHIKACIMDQSLVVGVGNIYASEALFQAGIHPETLASSLTPKQWQCLIDAIRTILSKAIASGGTTLKDFAIDDTLGYFAQELSVYDRAGAPCHVCKHPISSMRQLGRMTYYCAICQPGKTH